MKTEKSWSIDRHVRLCRKIAKLFGFKLRFYVDLESMPKVARAFDDVHAQDAIIHIHRDTFVGLRTSLWHEIGHLVASDEASRAGVNWTRPYPRATRARCAHPQHEKRLRLDDSRDDRNEANAVSATAALVRLFRVPREERQEILSEVNDKPGQHDCGNRAFVRRQVRKVWKALGT